MKEIGFSLSGGVIDRVAGTGRWDGPRGPVPRDLLRSDPACLALATTANATQVVAGNLVLEKLRSTDGSVPSPLRHLKVEFSKDGNLQTRGLPTCPTRKLVATTAARAMRACAGALVGTGFATAVLAFPEQAPISASTRVLFFNAPPIDGDPALTVHGHLEMPAPTTSGHVSDRMDPWGSLGYRAQGDTARIAGGYGSLTYFRLHLGREWNFHGRRMSYINAHCAVPNRTRLLGEARLDTWTEPCSTALSRQL